MSITDELREWVRNRVAEFSIGGVCSNDLNTIADRIDSEYAVYRAAVDANDVSDSWERIISDAVILGRQFEWADNSSGDADSERDLVERCRRLASHRMEARVR